MTIAVRPASLDSDRDALTEALTRWLAPEADAHRFDWLYARNAHGPAQAWLAYEEENGMLLGASAVFPRRLCWQGSQAMGCVLGDFCIHPLYRSLGPAVQLQRATLEGIRMAGFEFAYDFPSASMVGVYRRLGLEPRAQFVRYAKPLRADRKVAERVRWAPLAQGLSAAGNWMLEMRDHVSLGDTGWSVGVHSGPCGEEFSALAEKWTGSHGLCVQRSAAYLNWRFCAHPHRRHEILVARRDGVLGGYAIFTQSEGTAALVDLFGAEAPGLWRGLLTALSRLLRERGAMSLSASLPGSHPRAAALEAAGFRARAVSPVLVFRPGQNAGEVAALEGPSWFLMDGDRES